MDNLYHYTSVDGFEGVIKNNSIRMTKSDFLNDPNDCNLFIKLIDKYLNSHPTVLSDAISVLSTNQVEVSDLYKNKNCDLIHYIEYIQKNIGLYVMSLTKINDCMNMWNYYGHGGMELEFSIDNLVEAFRSTFVSEKEFLTEAKVIYANSELDVEKITVPDFSKFVLINKDSKNIFEDHRSFIADKSTYKADHLYTTSSLDKFINTYLKSYVASLEYLLKNKIIDVSTNSDIVFNKVFDNISKLNNFYYWKHDLSLYMLVLSALIKSDTYEYEYEHRIVYFEYAINAKKTILEEYSTKNLGASQFIYPYITFKKEKLLKGALQSVTISPVTSNLPINADAYTDTLKKFLISKEFDETISVRYSKHKIRW